MNQLASLRERVWALCVTAIQPVSTFLRAGFHATVAEKSHALLVPEGIPSVVDIAEGNLHDVEVLDLHGLLMALRGWR